MPVGARVITQIRRPDPALVARFAAHHSADLSDVMGNVNTMDRAIAPVCQPVRKAVGVAVTVAIPTGSLAVLKAAIQQAQAGDILVVNAFGHATSAVIGANICRGMLHRGLVGLVVDGAIRDVSELREEGLPVFAASVATAVAPLYGPGEVNTPIACGRVVVQPGDIVVADEDGVVVVPPAHADEILARVTQLEANHAALQDTLRRGEVTNIAAIERQLRADGFEFSHDLAAAGRQAEWGCGGSAR